MKCWKSSVKRDSLIKLISRLLTVFLAAGILLGQFLWAQDEPAFRSQANIVLVPALVRDAAGHAVYGLGAKDFIIEDNGAQQTVHLDEDAQAEPLSIMVAIQIGRSARRERPHHWRSAARR